MASSAAHFKELLLAEERRSATNVVKIEQEWKRLLHQQKTVELREQIKILAASHERQVDRKDAIIQLLDEELEAAEEMMLIAQRSHLQNIDSLVDLQRRSQNQLREEFEVESKELEETFQREEAELIKVYDSTKKRFEELRISMKDRFDETMKHSRDVFQSRTQTLKEKHLEDFNLLKYTLDNALKELYENAKTHHQDYIQHSEEQRVDFEKLREKDDKHRKDIDSQKLKYDRLQQQIQSWKIKLADTQKDYEMKNEALREEETTVLHHHKMLKGKLLNFRDSQKERLLTLANSYHNCCNVLDERIAVGERILRLAELCRKEETVQERVDPFVEDMVETDNELNAQYLNQTYGVDTDGPVLLQPLGNFQRKTNKVLLDKLALEKEHETLIRENENLKLLLRQYLNGISVSDEVLNEANPLFMVSSAL
eukprot:TRINITY_DN2181_c0_g1_i1.p1 TRINITY_DN2181_c0_g1~~TRINITY_DN2181_c0_g1_i1.p1  ORF type:complete len:436 (-),score=147.18 TRINITY_DN2181_c0_g1_i1:82-1362(-)